MNRKKFCDSDDSSELSASVNLADLTSESSDSDFKPDQSTTSSDVNEKKVETITIKPEPKSRKKKRNKKKELEEEIVANYVIPKSKFEAALRVLNEPTEECKRLNCPCDTMRPTVPTLSNLKHQRSVARVRSHVGISKCMEMAHKCIQLGDWDNVMRIIVRICKMEPKNGGFVRWRAMIHYLHRISIVCSTYCTEAQNRKMLDQLLSCYAQCKTEQQKSFIKKQMFLFQNN